MIEPSPPGRLKGILLSLVFAAAACGAVLGLVELRTRQLGPEARALESRQLAIARHLFLFRNLDALEARKDLPPCGGILTEAEVAIARDMEGPGDAQAEWSRLPAAVQARIQESYRSLQELAPVEQRELLERYRHFETLPPESRQKLLCFSEEIEKLSPEARETRLKDLRGQRNL